jgi:H+/Cl- antiporter ClcA
VSSTRRPAPPPLEASDQAVIVAITTGWAIGLIVLLALWSELPGSDRWWIWTCVTGIGCGLFGLWYVPRLKRSRERTAERRAAESAAVPGPGE